jgi:hypothetical protein
MEVPVGDTCAGRSSASIDGLAHRWAQGVDGLGDDVDDAAEWELERVNHETSPVWFPVEPVGIRSWVLHLPAG